MDQYKDSLVQYIDEPKQYYAFLVQYSNKWINIKTVCRMDKYKDSLVQYIDESKQYQSSYMVQYIDKWINIKID